MQPLLKDLDHVVVLLLLEDEFFIEYLVYIDDRVFNFSQHLLELVFDPRDDLFRHGLLELLLDHSSYCCVIDSGKGNATLTWIDLDWLSTRSNTMRSL